MNWTVFEEAQKRLGLNKSQLAKEIGVSTSLPGQWQKNGKIPKYAGLACEALLRRNNLSSHKGGQIILKGKDLSVVMGNVELEEVRPGIWILEEGNV